MIVQIAALHAEERDSKRLDRLDDRFDQAGRLRSVEIGACAAIDLEVECANGSPPYPPSGADIIANAKCRLPREQDIEDRPAGLKHNAVRFHF